MKKVILFQCLCLVAIAIIWVKLSIGSLPSWAILNQLAISCILSSSLGGILYCTRAIYINKCVRKDWDSEWETWYYLRPVASSITGLVSFLFLKAGLVILDAESSAESSEYGFLAFAFIAGLNVDKFVLKIEDIALVTFGIQKSRAAEDGESNK